MKYQAKIIGAGHALPSRIVTSDELESSMNFEKLNIRKGMSTLLSGVRERRFAEENENSSDYAVMAGKMALKNANLSAEEIDLLLFCSITQDFMEPATAMKVQNELGCVNANCYDVKNACNGFLTGIEIANMYIETERAENILIVSGEVLSRFLQMNYKTADEIQNANATFAIGDGGGALVLRAVECDEPIYKSKFKSVGVYWDDGVLWGGGTMHAHDVDKFYFQNETKEMIKTNFARSIEFYSGTFNELMIDKENIALFIPHQITKYLTVKACEMLDLHKEKVVDQVEFLGNNGCASIPIAISRALQENKISLNSGQEIVLFGFGNGISMATLMMKL